MTQYTSHDYDRVAYPTMAHPQTFAEVLSIKGFLRGLQVAPPERCRVLELGCGDGFNLAAMAAVYPDSTYTGIDYSTDAVARGRTFLAELGLKQVRLEAVDIRALTQLEPTLGEFDYIIAHGVYSWVPPEVREALLATIGRLLAPQGVAFVSYLALPGAHMREFVRTIIRFHTRDISDPAEQVRQSRSVLRLISKASLEPNHYTQWITAELDTIEKHADEALFHDELSSVSAPLLFTDFIGHAATHGLQFLSEAECVIPVSRALSDEAREQLRPLETNRILLEQYLDFMEGRRFRQTLLCRKGLGEKLDTGRLNQLWISCRATPAGGQTSVAGTVPLEFFGLKKSSIRASTPATKAALLELAARGGEAIPFPELLTTIRERLSREGLPIDANFDSTMRQYLCRACLPGLIEFSWQQRPYAVSVPARPDAHPLARWLISRDASSVLSYTGRFVEVTGAPGRHLLTLLDGSRDIDDLAAEMRLFLSRAYSGPNSDGANPIPTLPGNIEFSGQLMHSLAGLTALGLLKRFPM